MSGRVYCTVQSVLYTGQEDKCMTHRTRIVSQCTTTTTRPSIKPNMSSESASAIPAAPPPPAPAPAPLSRQESCRLRACALTSDSSCLSLAQILRSFGAPLSEAWAWATAHEACAALAQAVQGAQAGSGSGLWLVREAEELLLHVSGEVHAQSFTNRGRILYLSESNFLPYPPTCFAASRLVH